MEFCNENQFNICDTILPPDTFTDLSPPHNFTSWLDHVLCSGVVNVIEIKIIYEFALFDHFPVFTVIGMETGDSLINLKDNLVKQFVDWGKFNKEYVRKMEALMSNVDMCDRIGCTDDHRRDIDGNYDQIVKFILESSQDYVYAKEMKFTPVPGWNRYCKARYSEARAALFEWISDGRQRFGDTFEKMKQTRKIFINALNYCKKNKDKISDNVIADKYRTGDCKEFWKKVNKRRTNYNSKLCEIDGKNSNEEIVEPWPTTDMAWFFTSCLLK